MTSPDTLRLAIDIGGTFTDTVLMRADGSIAATVKTPTTPASPAVGALQGAQEVLARAGAEWGQIGSFIHGTTLGTNALIERRGARVATITTKGFRDILKIAYERRYSQYDINIDKPDLIVERRHAFTIGGRIDARGEERAPLDTSAVPALAGDLRTAGIEAVAICLLHAYANPSHEAKLAQLLRAALPDLVVSVSHEVSPEAREFDRLCTTLANAYIQPLMARYLGEIAEAFADAGLTCPILMMTAGGGMMAIETAARLPIRLVESGPAGGAILAAEIARDVGAGEVLSFDMGGTTAKLCLIDNHRPQTARSFEIARAARFVKGSGMPVRIPVIEMIEIGAGGGSIAKVDRLGRVLVGPESAGADPGPAAFGHGGADPTVTDADVLQGLIPPETFAAGKVSLDIAAAESAMRETVAAPLKTSAASAATAVSEIVDEAMAAAGRMHAVESGKDISQRLMIAFGGNGPLHATRLARRAGVPRVLIPRDPGVGSAVGFLYAPVSFELIRSFYATLDGLDRSALAQVFAEMEAEAETVVAAGAADAVRNVRRVAFMRYHGQGHEIEIVLPDGPIAALDTHALTSAFEAEYAQQFGRRVPGMTIEVLNWGLTLTAPIPAIGQNEGGLCPEERAPAPSTQSLWCHIANTWVEAPVYARSALAPGTRIPGPALITEPQTTSYVSADFIAELDAAGRIWMTQIEERAP